MALMRMAEVVDAVATFPVEVLFHNDKDAGFLAIGKRISSLPYFNTSEI